MFSIGRKIKYDLVKYILKIIKKNFSKKTYSFFLFLSVIKGFRKISKNNKKKKDKFSSNLDKINHFEYGITSQNNEDGIIEHIFTKTSNKKYFVEFGFDFFECNSINLIKNGWSGLLIDADEEKCIKMDKCINFFYPKSKVKIINEKIYKENINNLIYSNIDSDHIDFLSIDIDGNDYWVLDEMKTEKVNVLCSEYNPWIGNNVQKVMPYDKNFIYQNDYYFGASLLAYVNLLNSKGFDLIAVDSSGTNAFYIKKEMSDNFEILSPQKSFKKATKFHSKEECIKIENYVQSCNFKDLKN